MASIEMKQYTKRLSADNDLWEQQDAIKSAYIAIYETSEKLIKNTGKISGKEVVQIYLKAPQGKLGNPARKLIGFAKTQELTPEEKKEQHKLRKEFIASVRMNLRSQLDNINIQEKDGSITNLGEKYGRKKSNLYRLSNGLPAGCKNGERRSH